MTIYRLWGGEEGGGGVGGNFIFAKNSNIKLIPPLNAVISHHDY